MQTSSIRLLLSDSMLQTVVALTQNAFTDKANDNLVSKFLLEDCGVCAGL